MSGCSGQYRLWVRQGQLLVLGSNSTKAALSSAPSSSHAHLQDCCHGAELACGIWVSQSKQASPPGAATFPSVPAPAPASGIPSVCSPLTQGGAPLQRAHTAVPLSLQKQQPLRRNPPWHSHTHWG